MKTDRWFGPDLGRPFDPPSPTQVALPRTALPVHRGLPCHLEAHLLRLQAGAAALGAEVPWLPGIQAELEAWLGADGPADVALRLVLHPEAARLAARLEPLPTVLHPYRLRVLPHPLQARRGDAAIVHKGLAGPWNQAVLSAAREAGAEDALLLWSDGTLAETAIASVALERGEFLIVPPPLGRVASLAERLDLPDWARARELRIEVGSLPLASAREGRLWCMNALRGIWPAVLA
ncbi:MAG: aminotransferase class IV [Geothrix sp.]|uniref:aminotransferase class IV n=1 Tax=Geothrix sp. TaxID=1962974 RepID=UPI0017FD2317|nr:aminotransferase class IV [Geothrix sp.]NWJ39549.1 aminotransferase class IV [Geothrix sp.]WIL19230.1 MAG: aminotransferase class IV [Geothrix sp.]